MEAILHTFTMRKVPERKKNEAETEKLIKTSLGYMTISSLSQTKFKYNIAKSFATKKCKLKSEKLVKTRD